MNNLLFAGFCRLKKSKIFLIFIAFMFAAGLDAPIRQYMNMKKTGFVHVLDHAFFMHVMYMGVITAVFISLFIGTEYSDGTIRNKLATGHSRISIYLSNLILCTAASALISLSYMIACACAGIPLLGFFQMDASTAVALILCDLMIGATYSSLFLLAAMLIHSKAVLSVVTILSAFLLLFAATYLFSMLSQPQMRTDYVMGANGEVESSKPVPNESYVSGTKREAYEFLMEFLPSGQDIILVTQNAPLPRIFVYDGLIILVSSLAGMLGFIKKDIK